MKKIISLFVRDYQGNRQVTDEIVEGAEWVVLGEGIATRKYDGTCCLIEDGKLWKRYELKKGKVPPIDFRPATEPDPNTGKQQGWVPVGVGPDDKWHREACMARAEHDFEHGTYELCGPKIQGNPEGFEKHVLIKHGHKELPGAVPRSFELLRKLLGLGYVEGIVWHHPDGRMVKIKAKDFGFKRKGVMLNGKVV